MINNKEIFTLNEVKTYLQFKKNETVLEWLSNNQVPVFDKSKKSKMVYKVDFETAIFLPLAKSLIKQYPNTWKDYLLLYIENIKVYNMVLTKINDTLCKIETTTKIKPRNIKEEKLLSRLLS